MINFYDKLISKIGFPAFDLISSSNITEYYKYLNNTKNNTYEELKDLQSNKLKNVLDNAYKNIDKYKHIKYRKDPEEFLKEFPVVNRGELLSEDKDLLIDNYDKKGIYHSSGGSTGERVRRYLSNREQSYSQATQLFWLKKIGYKYGDRIVQIGIKRSRENNKRIKDLVLNTDYMYYFEMDEKERVESLKNNSRYKKVFFMGYPNIALEIMELSLKYDIDLKFTGILSFGENLSSETYKKLKNFYNCQILNTYGCKEGILAASGLQPEKMDVMMENTYIEILDDNNNPVKEGNQGNIILTNLNGYNMPLIRYKIGDVGALQKGCGVERDKILYVAGRDNDYIHTSGGEKYHLYAMTGGRNTISEKVKQFQWHQKDINNIRIYYVPGNKGLLSKHDIDEFVSIAKKTFKTKDLNIEFEAVDKLKKYKSGKLQRVINDLEM